jgi:hypothetical protein
MRASATRKPPAVQARIAQTGAIRCKRMEPPPVPERVSWYRPSTVDPVPAAIWDSFAA